MITYTCDFCGEVIHACQVPVDLQPIRIAAGCKPFFSAIAPPPGTVCGATVAGIQRHFCDARCCDRYSAHARYRSRKGATV